MDLHKMFNLLVAGGFAAVSAGAATTVCSGCATEGVPVRDAGPRVDSGSDVDAGFPREGPAPFDAGSDAGADAEDGGFPSEGPAPLDSGT